MKNKILKQRTVAILLLVFSLLFFLLIAKLCQSQTPPTSAQIEAMGLHALNTHSQSSINTLKMWANQEMPVAQRELGLVYAAFPTMSLEATLWLQKAAILGDIDAQFELAEANYKARLGLSQNYTLAWKWYASAARGNNAKASFILARMAKYGEGIPRNLALSVEWLKRASTQGNAQAMFLLSNAYASGEGVDKDLDLAQAWLEHSAQGDYPLAIHAIALSLENSGTTSDINALAARHLFKEATDERNLHWNKYQ